MGWGQRGGGAGRLAASIASVHLILRTLLRFWLSRFQPRLGLYDVGRVRMRVLPTDLDILRHMNNGVYLSIADLGRFDLLMRNGVWRVFQQRGWYPVVVNETITFRRSLNPWVRFTLESRILGFDDKAVFVEQRFVVGGEIYAQLFIRGRFLKRSGGTVTIPELLDAVGGAGTPPGVPEWLRSWSEASALPPSRAAAPSEWD